MRIKGEDNVGRLEVCDNLEKAADKTINNTDILTSFAQGERPGLSVLGAIGQTMAVYY